MRVDRHTSQAAAQEEEKSPPQARSTRSRGRYVRGVLGQSPDKRGLGRSPNAHRVGDWGLGRSPRKFLTAYFTDRLILCVVRICLFSCVLHGDLHIKIWSRGDRLAIFILQPSRACWWRSISIMSSTMGRKMMRLTRLWAMVVSFGGNAANVDSTATNIKIGWRTNAQPACPGFRNAGPDRFSCAFSVFNLMYP